MNELTDETELFDRIARKKQKNLMLSQELAGVLARVADEGGESQYVERVVWQALVEEHGRDEVVAAVEDVQADLDDAEIMDRAKTYSLPV